MELIGHSITHFNGTSELDRKLVILHLSNAVELLLKDMVLDGGDSIYKNPKETITIHGCVEALNTKKIVIPYINKLNYLSMKETHCNIVFVNQTSLQPSSI